MRWMSLALLAAAAASGQTIGLFSPPAGSPYPAGASPIAVASGDFNGDGKIDLAIANEYNNTFRGGGSLTILLNNASSFVAAAGSPIYVPFSPEEIVTGDFNNDGILDLALSNNGLSTNSGQLAIFLGNGQGGFAMAPGFPFTVGPGSFSMAVADFNHDGNQDIAITLFRSNQVQILMGNGLASFVSSTFPTDAGPRAVVTGDFNGDGNADLAIANFTSNDVTVLLGDGTGNFNPAAGSPFPAANPSTNLSPIAIAAGDFNEDGHLDLAIANSGLNTVSILFGDGTGVLSSGTSTPFKAGSFPTSIVSGDVNGDGHLDLAIANANSNNITVLTGDGTGSFSVALGNPFAVGAAPQSLVEADFNADGRPDLAAINFTSQTVSLLYNQSCTMSVQPASLTLDGSGASTSLSIIATNPAACAWSATTDASWITLAVNSGLNSGYEPISFSPNPTGAPRSATVQIAGVAITVTQMGTVQQFSDVQPVNYYFDAVDFLKESAVTSGCGSGNYCPSLPVTRAEMAVFLIASILGPNGGPVPAFPFFNDVPPGSFGFAQIQQLFELGITAGCGAGNFCPNDTLTRAQMAVLIIRARYGSGGQFTYQPAPYFTDVPSNAFGFGFIQRMRQDNITAGCGANIFCPNNSVLRGDMAIFLERGMFDHLLPPGMPYISSLNMNALSAGSTADINVTGVATNFIQGTTLVNPIPGVLVNSVTVTSPTTMTVNVTAGSTPTNQPEPFWVTTGSEDAVLPSALAIQ